MSWETLLPFIITGVFSFVTAYYTAGAAVRNSKLKDDGSAALQFAQAAGEIAKMRTEQEQMNSEQREKIEELHGEIDALRIEVLNSEKARSLAERKVSDAESKAALAERNALEADTARKDMFERNVSFGQRMTVLRQDLDLAFGRIHTLENDNKRIEVLERQLIQRDTIIASLIEQINQMAERLNYYLKRENKPLVEKIMLKGLAM
jgi:chromosome segregation ATPase